MRAWIIVSAFVIFFVLIATAVVAWNHQHISESEQSSDPSLAADNLGDESSYSFLESPAPVPQATKSDRPGTRPLTPEMIQEIESIRRQLGINLFSSDSTEDQPAKQEFRDALYSLASQGSGICEPASASQPSTVGPNADSDHSAPSWLEPLANRTQSVNARLVDSVQQAIIALEQRAALLEEQKQYAASDRSRRLAHKLRKEIRTLEEDLSQ